MNEPQETLRRIESGLNERGALLLCALSLSCLISLIGFGLGVLCFAITLSICLFYDRLHLSALEEGLALIEVSWRKVGSDAFEPPADDEFTPHTRVYEQASVDPNEDSELEQKEQQQRTQRTRRRGGIQWLTAQLINPSAAGVLTITPVSPAGDHRGVRLMLTRAAEVDLHFPFSQPEAGVLLVWGLELQLSSPLGFHRCSTFIPISQRMTFTPCLLSEVRGLFPSSSLTIASGRPRSGQSVGRVRGDEGEFEELRAYQPGDPRRRIAWLPSARRGSLLVRVHQQPLEPRPSLCVEIGSQLREGRSGERLIDLAVDLANSCLDFAPAFPWGLYSFDHLIFGRFAPAGAGHLNRDLRRHLLSLISPNLKGFNDIDESQLIAYCAAVLRRQGRLQQGGWRSVSPEIHRALLDPLRELEPEPLLRQLIGAEGRESLEHSMRRFCIREGVRLPYRGPVSVQARERGLAAAVQAAQRDGSTHIFLIAQATGFHAEGAAARTIRQLRRRGIELHWLQIGEGDDTLLASLSKLIRIQRFS